jgi:hypothetical protein
MARDVVVTWLGGYVTWRLTVLVSNFVAKMKMQLIEILSTPVTTINTTRRLSGEH